MFPKSDAVFSFYVIVWSRSRLCLFHHVQEIAMHTGILRQFRMERRNQLAALSGCHDLAVHFCQNFCAAGNGSDYLGSLPKHPKLMTSFLTYLDNDRNMNQTAKELFIHVNSVKYRLQQIYNILQIQLNTSYDWLQIQLAAILYRYLLNNK